MPEDDKTDDPNEAGAGNEGQIDGTSLADIDAGAVLQFSSRPPRSQHQDLKRP